MVSEKDYAECQRFVARKHIAKGGKGRNARRVSAEAIIIRHAVDVLDSGKPNRLLLKVLKRSRKDCGFSLQTWLAIISMLIEVVGWVLQWWMERQKPVQTETQYAEHNPPHIEN